MPRKSNDAADAATTSYLNAIPEGRGRSVVVGMSGGVDSSVAAWLLKARGYDVIGMFMKNWEEKDDSGACTSEKDAADARRVCEQLDIPYYAVEFVREYWNQVFSKFLEDYRAGFTPNPDVLCNREIKFNAFYRKARALGAEFLATGHYSQIGRSGDGAQLVKGVDPGKDQTYFLHAIDGKVLDHVLFPIGHLLKSQVREIALKQKLSTHAKKDSTGICFIGERDFREFLSKYVAIQPGEFQRLDGSRVGRHQGAAFYTLGQRRGLGLGGEGDRWYVVAKDPAANIVIVERGDDHPALYADELIASEVNWLDGQGPREFPFRCRAKVRYRQDEQHCVLMPDAETGCLRVTFDEPQRALTPRQFVVFYEGAVCLGGGVIQTVGPSYFVQARGLPTAIEPCARKSNGLTASAVSDRVQI